METGKEVVKISLNNIIPNRFQPRISFDEQALNELANSIKMYGILQPLILRPLGDKYEIIAGERRYKAATIAGLSEVPAILVNLDDQTSAELAIIENIQRKDLTAIEEAKSYKKLLDLGNYTQEQLASKMGKTQSTIANKLRLLNLIPDVQEALMNNLISERHARCLLQLKDDVAKQREVLNKIISDRLTVKDTDELIKNMMGGTDMNQNFQSFNTPNDSFNFNISNDLNNFSTPPQPSYTEDNSLLNNLNIPTMNNDTFNLGELSNPEMEIPSTPLANEASTFDFKSMFNTPTINNNEMQSNNMGISEFDSLLQIDEPQKIEIPTVEPQIPQVKIETPPPVNKYFPSLEDTPVNMSFGSGLNIPTSPILDEPVTNNNTSNSIDNTINRVRDMVKNVEQDGYKIETEELDLPDVYQITIKINKNNINNENFPRF